MVALSKIPNSNASTAGEKRTIMTSGEKVYPIRYQLGQSTIFYFGFKPETVICGNKNYFNIEKIKDGITVQPLSNLSTNLTVISGTKRYLFYLTPAGGARPDGFVEVRWVPPSLALPVKPLVAHATTVAREIGQRVKFGAEGELILLQEKKIDGGKRRIFELEIRNLGKKSISTREVEVVAVRGSMPISSQVTIWEDDEIGSRRSTKGRLITSNDGSKLLLNLVIGFRGNNTKIQVKGY